MGLILRFGLRHGDSGGFGLLAGIDHEAAAKEIIGELQSLFARHRINFEWGMLNFEFFQLSSFRFFFRGAGCCEREDEAWERWDGGGVSRVRNGLSDEPYPMPSVQSDCRCLKRSVWLWGQCGIAKINHFAGRPMLRNALSGLG